MAERIWNDFSEIEKKMNAIWISIGVSKEDAEMITETLLEAEVSGVESHGLIRLKAYVERVKTGSITAAPEITIKEDGVTLQVNGGNGFGQVVMSRTIDECIKTSRMYGVAIATVCHSNHFGMAAYYAKRLAAAGCIGFVATNAGATMAPFGGMELLLGTNPFSVAFPSDKQNFCVDMATSAVAKGKIRIFAKDGNEIPLGWALDKFGNDTQNAEEALKGILLPMGGHKGYALAMVVDAICGLLSGANLSCETPSMFQTGSPANVGHFVCAIDIAHFLPLAEFEVRAQEWFTKIKTSRPRDGMQILIPGEPESERKASSSGKLYVLAETMKMLDEYYKKIAM